MTLPIAGEPIDRVDGPAKITGTARFTAEFRPAGLVYGELVVSTIASGRIERLDTNDAERAPGVLLVITHENAPRVNAQKQAERDPILPLFQDDRVHFDRQPVALVLAQTPEQARYAASLVRARYVHQTPVTHMQSAPQCEPEAFLGSELQHTRGDPQTEIGRAAIRLDAVYTTPVHHHNPMEAHASVAQWDGDRLTVHDSTQFISGVRSRLAHVFGISQDLVRVVCPFVGGGFGCKGTGWAHVFLAAMAAKMLERPVRIELSRAQMYGFVGFRPRTIQTMTIGAEADGRLRALMHDTFTQTAQHDTWIETSGAFSRSLYAVPHYRMTHRLALLNTTRPTFTRAPGESTGKLRAGVRDG